MARTERDNMDVKILEDIKTERNRQDAKWGANQAHPDVHPEASDSYDACIYAGISTEQSAKNICEEDAKFKNTNWSSILTEEVSESVAAAGKHDLPHTREELVQVAAVCAAWIEDIDRRLANAQL